MICLTGDLHHMSLKTGNQLASDITEVRVAQMFLRFCDERGIKLTYFVSGRSFAEEAEDLRPIVDSENVEIGGHNYGCFQPALPHRVWKKLTGSYHGPSFVQKADVLRTMSVIRRTCGRTIKCWRNHMYMHDQDTERVLYECGIDAVSDTVKRGGQPSIHPTGILEVPINIIPDHEHLYHAERTPRWVQQWIERYNWSDDFGPASYYIEEWTEIVLAGLQENERKGQVSTLIIHPITMYLCDGFSSAKRILDYIADCETVHMSDLVAERRYRRSEVARA